MQHSRKSAVSSRTRSKHPSRNTESILRTLPNGRTSGKHTRVLPKEIQKQSSSSISKIALSSTTATARSAKREIQPTAEAVSNDDETAELPSTKRRRTSSAVGNTYESKRTEESGTLISKISTATMKVVSELTTASVYTLNTLSSHTHPPDTIDRHSHDTSSHGDHGIYGQPDKSNRSVTYKSRTKARTPQKLTSSHLEERTKEIVEKDDVTPTIAIRSRNISPSPGFHLRKHHVNSEALAPAFPTAWQAISYTSSVSDTVSPPIQANNIDLLPHQCCLHSLKSHCGYSWLTSKRRCNCSLDSDHNSSESLTESYLGCYASERFGWEMRQSENGGEGEGPRLMHRGERIAEEWWLKSHMQTMKEFNRDGDGRAKKSAASLASLVDDKTTSIFKRASTLVQVTTAALVKHLDYMPRQPHLTIEMRAILMDWLVELAAEYSLHNETLYLSVVLVDRALTCSYAVSDAKNNRPKNSKYAPQKSSNYDVNKENESTRAENNALWGKMIVQKDMLQCVGCACTLIASKLLEVTPPTADDFAYISDNSYERKEILDMENRICTALKFNINFKTPYEYVHRFLMASFASMETGANSGDRRDLRSDAPVVTRMTNHAMKELMERMVFYLLDLSTLEYKFVTVRPSLITASAIYLARVTLGIREPLHNASSVTPAFTIDSIDVSFYRAAQGYWSKTLEHYTGYDMWDLEESVKRLRRLHENAETSKLKSIYSKYKKAQFGKVALKTVVTEKELGFI